MSSFTPLASHFGAADVWLLDALQTHDQNLRAVLCTLTRHGVAFRQMQPDRSAGWLDTLNVHPLYKGAQFLFDVLEWEDYILDGPQPAPLDRKALLAALERLPAGLRQLKPGTHLAAAALPRAPAITPPDPLPEIEPGFHLFRDLALGLLSIVLAEYDRLHR
ncbi:hypothetical protein [Eleftheria terrae]|uniref:hypothetical protein n=1 Tax=Eleftheria terrae TaxID=1597781 RepID=UPI00263A4EEA|nr:hypothetical protein [Eleftheria terrae]WKB51324.1 hypothetical protein N7L95_16100 [Eleftheria terrae]